MLNEFFNKISTTEQLMADNTFANILAITNPIEKDKALFHLLQIAKANKITSEFKQRLKAFENSLVPVLKGKSEVVKKTPQQKNEVAEFEGVTYDTGRWIVDPDGSIYTLGHFGEINASRSWFYLKAYFLNLQTDTYKVLIAYKNNKNQWKENIFPSDIISNARNIIKLSNFGVNINSENAKNAVTYISEFQLANKEIIPTYNSTYQLGWNTDYTSFLPFTEKDLYCDMREGFAKIYNALHEKGDKKKYMDFIKECRASNSKEQKLAIATSLASVIVKICNINNFILHFYGESGKGKTLLLMLAASIWGNAKKEGEYIASVKNTETSFETQLDFLNHLPFLCDDISASKDTTNKRSKNDSYSELIYFLCSGAGKGRATKDIMMQRLRSWQNCSITTAEKPITSEVSQLGEILRVIEIQTTDEYIFRDELNSINTAEFLNKNYGFLGKMFIDSIIEIGINTVTEIFKNFVKDIREVSLSKEGKQINSMACILTADHILKEYIFKDKHGLKIDDIIDNIEDKDNVNENVRAYEFIKSFVSRNISKFQSTSYEPNERFGMLKDEPDGYWAYINATVFKSIICKEGEFSHKIFIDWAIKNNCAKGAYGRKDFMLKYKGVNSYYFCILMSKGNDIDG